MRDILIDIARIKDATHFLTEATREQAQHIRALEKTQAEHDRKISNLEQIGKASIYVAGALFVLTAAGLAGSLFGVAT